VNRPQKAIPEAVKTANAAPIPDPFPASPVVFASELAHELGLTPETVANRMGLYLRDPRHPRALPCLPTGRPYRMRKEHALAILSAGQPRQHFAA
jgi:hypothetical protein